MDFTFRDVEIILATIAVRDGGAWLWRLYQRRYIEPKQRHRQVFVEQRNWYEERAAKLAVFGVQLSQEPAPDKWKLARFVSQLDTDDRKWAMKSDDIEALRAAAARKGKECHDNAGECGRMADEVAYTILS
jgi:hypothetical protein